MTGRGQAPDPARFTGSDLERASLLNERYAGLERRPRDGVLAPCLGRRESGFLFAQESDDRLFTEPAPSRRRRPFLIPGRFQQQPTLPDIAKRPCGAARRAAIAGVRAISHLSGKRRWWRGLDPRSRGRIEGKSVG